MGSHCIDLLEFVTGSRAACVYATNQSLVHDYTSEDTSTVLLRMDNGAQMIVDSLFNVPDAASRGLFEIYGTKGALYGEGTIGQMPTGKITAMLSDQGEYDAQQEREPSSQTFDLEAEPVDMYAAEIEDFSRAVLGDHPPAIPGEEGLWNLRVLHACYDAGRTGCEIKLA
jgi:predicted dehydrogenase